MKIRLSFDNCENGALDVATEPLVGASDAHALVVHTLYEHEDDFLRRLIAAKLSHDDVTQVVVEVLHCIARSHRPKAHIDIDLTPHQVSILGLSRRSDATVLRTDRDIEKPPGSGHSSSTPQAGFYEFLMQSPVPFAVMKGPRHELSLANPAYLQLISAFSLKDLLGKPVREVLRGFLAPRYFLQMDRVFETGTPYTARDAHSSVAPSHGHGFDDHYFDFLFQPIRNEAGTVDGVMVQVSDVTDRFTSQQVTETREQELYRQWAELEAIYQGSPVGMAMIDARTHRLLRMNARQAKIFGIESEIGVGRDVSELTFHLPAFNHMLLQATMGVTVRDYALEELDQSGRKCRRWLVNLTPVLDGEGKVTAICITFSELIKTADLTST